MNILFSARAFRTFESFFLSSTGKLYNNGSPQLRGKGKASPLYLSLLHAARHTRFVGIRRVRTDYTTRGHWVSRKMRARLSDSGTPCTRWSRLRTACRVKWRASRRSGVEFHRNFRTFYSPRFYCGSAKCETGHDLVFKTPQITNFHAFVKPRCSSSCSWRALLRCFLCIL